MKLKLKESIRANGIQYLPPSVVDAEEIGISQADVEVLVRRGTAELVQETAKAVQEAPEAPVEAAPEAAEEAKAEETVDESTAVVEDEPKAQPSDRGRRGRNQG